MGKNVHVNLPLAIPSLKRREIPRAVISPTWQNESRTQLQNQLFKVKKTYIVQSAQVVGWFTVCVTEITRAGGQFYQ